MITKTNKTIALVMACAAVASGLSSTSSSFAAGTAVTLAPSTASVSTAGSITLSLTTTAIVPVGGTIQVARPNTYTGTAALAVSAGAIGATTNAASGTDVMSTATVTTAIPAGALTVTISGLTSPSAASNNAFKFYTSAGDYGATLQYVGQANVVQVRARVPLLLSFAIRNSADTANTNTCDMGDLNVSTVGFCDYRLKVATNARNGYTINLSTSGNFTTGTDDFTNAAAGAGGTGGTNGVAGTETYGARITKGSITGVGGTTTLASAYDAGATNEVNYTATGPVALLTANKPNAPATTDLTNTTLVRHEATISASTAAGLYTQTVTYTVAPSF